MQSSRTLEIIYRIDRFWDVGSLISKCTFNTEDNYIVVQKITDRWCIEQKHQSGNNCTLLAGLGMDGRYLDLRETLDTENS